MWKQRREYKPGAPLYAKLDLKFSGKPVARGELIPAEYIRSARDHLRLWRSGHAGHEQRSKYAALPVPVATFEIDTTSHEMTLDELTAPTEAATAPRARRSKR